MVGSSWAVAQEKPGDAPFAYAAPAFIKELDTRYPAQPPVPPSPPRYGGVLQFPAVVRAFDPTVGYRPELALVWDTLTEWEATWYFPEVQRTPVIRKTLATSWEMVTPSTWIFKLRQGVKFHNRPPVNGREMTAEDVKYSYELLKSCRARLHRAPAPAGRARAVAGLPVDLLPRAHPARRRRHHAARPGCRPHARRSRPRASGAGARPPLPGPVPHLDSECRSR